jgi:hypothetical protein
LCRDHEVRRYNRRGLSTSKEFTDLGLTQPPAHCAECAHVVRGRTWKPAVGGAVLAAIGVIVLVFVVKAGLVILLTGTTVAVGGLLLDRHRVTRARLAQPALPLVPNIDSLRIQETLRGELHLDQRGKYLAPITPVQGEIVAEMSLGKPDRDRLAKYRRAYRLAPGADIWYSAGYLVLRGPAGLEFLDGTQDILVPLTGNVTERPFLTAIDTRRTAKWPTTLTYRPRVAPDVTNIPVWLTPSLVPASDQRTLELELQWSDFGPEDKPLVISRIESMKLNVPISWGTVDRVTHQGNRATVGKEPNPDDADQFVRTIELPPLTLTEQNQREQSLNISIRFENRIELSDTIRGTMTVSFKGTVSGLVGISFHHPLGYRRQRRTDSVRTQLLIDFTLSLSGIRYQDTRVVPDRKRPRDQDKRETIDFPQVIPDHNTVVELTNAMSRQGYYVKRVVENPPRSGGRRADVLSRFWDIGGRRYNGVYPIDFHVVLTGEEVYRGEIRAHTGKTKVEIAVQGAYASPAMEARIEKEWKQLYELTAYALRRRGTASGATETNGYHLPDRAGPVGESTYHDSAPTRVAELRRRIDEADNAVLDKRISENTHHDIVTRARRELDGT